MSHKKSRPARRRPARWLKLAAAALAAVTAVTATTVSYGNRDSGAVTGGPANCVIVTDRP